jgi:hypothetical protein
MRIEGDGSVGIGTSSPTAKLEVVSSDGTETLRLHKSDVTITENEIIGEMLFTTADTTLNSNRKVIGAIKCFAEENFSGANANEGSLQFFTANATDLRNSAAPTPRMVIDENGSIGIGTTSPASKLHVSGGDSRHSGGKLIYEAGGVSDYFRIQRNSSSGRAQMQFADENTSELWRVGLTGGGGEDFVFYDGGANVLILDRSNNQAQFNNDVVAFYSSDKRLKENVKNIESPLEKLNKINGVEFDWIEKQGVHGNKGHDIGVIAQEIEEVLPEVVTTRDNGYKAVKYEKIVPLLIEAIKELKTEIEELKNG